MPNITSTRWIDNVRTTLEEVDRLFMSPHPDSTTTANWEVLKKFPEAQSITLNGKTIPYNYYEFSFDKMNAGSPVDEDTIRKTGFVIPYVLNGKIRYIISRNSGALSILRKLLNCEENNVVQKNFPTFSADLFVWLVSCVYTGSNVIECESDELENLAVDSIRGFKGDTEDLLTRVTAVGESVINIISTLSFLLESQKLNQITLDLGYRKHSNIDVSFSNKNTVSINLDRYQGELITDIASSKTISILFLTLYLEIIPIILQSYQGELESGQWSPSKCVTFLESVASDLSARVRQRVADLQARPQQLNMAEVVNE